MVVIAMVILVVVIFTVSMSVVVSFFVHDVGRHVDEFLDFFIVLEDT